MPSPIIKSKAVLYCRVSSKEQEDTGYSLPAQEKFLKEYGDRRNFYISRKFSVSESAGGKKKRETFNELMKYVKKNNIKVIICEKVDRLTRNLKDAVMINGWLEEDGKRQVHLVKDSLILHKDSRSQEKLNWNIRLVFAQNYIDNLSEEVKKGQKEKIAQGQYPTKPPLGYKPLGESGKKIHQIDENTAPYIRKMFEWYATGNYSIARLESELYQAGLRSRNGKRVGMSWIHRLLSEPFYYGKIRWKGEIYPAEHKEIINKDLFDKVQKLLKRKIQAPHYTVHNPLFKGKIHCEHCGGLVTWYTKKGHWYGHCNNHGEYRKCSQKTCVREDRIEEQLFPYFAKIAPKNKEVLGWIEDIINQEHSQQISESEKEVQRLTGLLEQIRRRKDKVYEDKIDGKIPLEFYERKFAEYSQEEENLEEALIRLNDRRGEYQQLSVVIHELAYKSNEIWDKANTDERRLELSEIFTNLTQDRLKLKGKYTLAAEYLANWIPKLNHDYELQKSVANKGKTGDFTPASPTWLAWRDSLRTIRWEELFPNPSVSLTQIRLLLSIVIQ